MTRKVRITHLITALDVGGANMMLYKLLALSDRERFEPAVVVTMEKGPLGQAIEALGIPVFPTGARRGQVSLGMAAAHLKQIRALKPDILQAWTYHSNIAASLLSPFLPRTTVFWNIRHTPGNLDAYNKLTSLLIRYGRWLSWQPKKILYNSQESARHHQALGYAARKTMVIPNGFDTEAFRPSETSRPALRQALGLPPEALIIAMVARYHPMKDHAGFLAAAGKLHQSHPGVHFALVGRGVDPENARLAQEIEAQGLNGRVHLLGERDDIAALTPGFDIASLASAWGDAFPNVLGEAMACGVPCVATAVGDAAHLIGESGVVVPPKDPEALAQGWRSLLDLGQEGRRALGEKAHWRIISHFSLADIVRQYERLYAEVACAS